MSAVQQAAVVTGASSGIGVAVAEELSAMGFGLVLTARREDRLRELAGRCENAAVVAGDILDPDMPQRLIDQAVASFGRCDVVVNNAGLIEAGTVEAIDLERVCHMVRVNVEAAFRMAYVALRHFKQTGAGYLINTSSVVGTKVRPTAGAYSGTKYAIEALSEALRLELAGSGVRVCCIEPGLVMTELHARWDVHPSQSMNIPRPLQAIDIARCVRFVLEQPDHVVIPRLMALPSDQAL